MFDIPLVVINEPLELHEGFVKMNGRKYSCEVGAWAFYIPELELKILHAVQDKVHCTHSTAPNRSIIDSHSATELKNNRYTIEEWIAAFTKTALCRAIENYVAASLLNRHGLGPKVNGLCFVKQFIAPYGNGTPSATAGFYPENLKGYPKKQVTSRNQLIQASVRPDKIESCLRQQIRGYVSDLNSVVGVMPIAHEVVIDRIHKLVLGLLGNCAETESPCCKNAATFGEAENIKVHLQTSSQAVHG